jgi:2-isopropylmalate synthase
MSSGYIHLFDTTLRDGQQTRGIDFTVNDKRSIADALDSLGLDYIEGGWPGANATDEEFFNEPPSLTKAKFVAFGMTRRAGYSADNDPVLAGLRDARCDAYCVVGKSWDFHVTEALGTTLDENLAMIEDSLRHLGNHAGEVLYDAEHFFDGFKNNKDYALACLEAARKAGARWIVLCDTNGGTLPSEVYDIVREVEQIIPGNQLGIHCHDDTGNAVANSLAAVEAGARQIQGTLNGIGERCGNADLVSLIPTLKLKTNFEIGVSDEAMQGLTLTSRLLDEIVGRSPRANAPYVGASAFAHKAGLHVSGIARNPASYEHIDPQTVGNDRQVVVSDQSGRANIKMMLAKTKLGMELSNDQVGRLLERVKEKEAQGLTFDGAEASFELLARQVAMPFKAFYDLDRFRVIDERRHNARGEVVVEAVALVTLWVGSSSHMEAESGNGPVNALDRAMRKALLDHYPCLKDMTLSDYKVRILDSKSGTQAVTRVMIESHDSKGRTWHTVGISANIIDASYMALHDAITWKLLQEGARALA